MKTDFVTAGLIEVAENSEEDLRSVLSVEMEKFVLSGLGSLREWFELSPVTKAALLEARQNQRLGLERSIERAHDTVSEVMDAVP